MCIPRMRLPFICETIFILVLFYVIKIGLTSAESVFDGFTMRSQEYDSLESPPPSNARLAFAEPYFDFISFIKAMKLYNCANKGVYLPTLAHWQINTWFCTTCPNQCHSLLLSFHVDQRTRCYNSIDCEHIKPVTAQLNSNLHLNKLILRLSVAGDNYSIPNEIVSISAVIANHLELTNLLIALLLCARFKRLRIAKRDRERARKRTRLICIYA